MDRHRKYPPGSRRARRISRFLLVGTAVVVYRIFDPVQTAWMLRCPTRQWFGLSCPPLRGATCSPCCTARAVAIGLDLQSLAAAGFGLVRTRLVRAISSRHASLARAVLLCAPGSSMPFCCSCGLLCAIFSVVDARPDEARNIIFFTPPTAHRCYSERGNCYALSRRVRRRDRHVRNARIALHSHAPLRPARADGR